MTAPVVLGIDPGGANTGIVVRQGPELLTARTVRRMGSDRHVWVDVCVDHVARIMLDHQVDLVGVEDLNPPNPHMGMISVKGVLDAAVVLGGVLGFLWAVDPHPPVLLVPPGGHGKAPKHAYPAGCSNPHLRAAWDQAGLAADDHRLSERVLR